MITLKQLYNIIEDVFTNHPEVNSVTRLDVKDYIGDRSKTYMNANVRYVSGNVQGKYINHNFLITLADRLTPTGENELEIISAAQLIAEDLYTVLGASFEFTFQKSGTYTPFTEADGDRIAGIYFQVNIQVLRGQNICVVPDKGLQLLPVVLPMRFV
jgi:hypothetical protein